MKLGDIFKISSGGTPDKKKKIYYENGTIPWIKTGDLKEKFVSNDVEQITLQGLNNCSAKLFPAGTVLVAMYGATIGACSILNYQASTNQACAAFLPNPQVLPDYLYYFLSSRKNLFIQNGVGGAQPNISATYLKTVPFKYVPIDVQIHIITVLDKLTTLISLRKQQLAKLDELVKARFVEMFGDPVINPMGWKLTRLCNLGDCKNGMNFHIDDSGVEIPCLGVSDFKNISVIDNIERLSKISLNEMPSEEYLLKNGDIVFVRSNGNRELVGRCVTIYPNDVPTTFSGFCIRFRLNTTEVTTTYLLMMLKAESMRKKLVGRGANIQNLNQKMLSEILVTIPPLKLQEEFSFFIKQISGLKLIIQQGLDKMEVLKKSLMQKYFG